MVFEDRSGTLWVGAGGLNRYDRAKGTFSRYRHDPQDESSLSSSYIRRIYEDRQGRLWIGTSRGLDLMDREQRTFRRFIHDPNDPTSIGAEHVVSMLEDSKGRFWVTTTSGGLSLMDLEKGTFTRFMNDPEDPESISHNDASYTNLSPRSYRFRVRASNSAGVWNEDGTAVMMTILPPWWRTWWAYALYGLLFIGGVVAVDRIQRRRLIAREQEKARERELEQAREIERAYNEIRQAKDRLVQQEKMASLGALTAGIAHEIKNPLNFVTNFAQLTEELFEDLEEERQAKPNASVSDVDDILMSMRLNAQKITEHGKRADGIVRSMLEHSRGTSGERIQSNVNTLVDEYVNLAYHGMRAQTADFNVTIERDYDETAGKVQMVPQEIGRVLLNLLNNAFWAVHEKASRVDGEYAPCVRVCTRRIEDAVEIRVDDNGPGIPANIREKIFEPFFTTKPTGSGTGLGLSLSYDIVTQGHGGDLILEPGDGRGATFSIRLPAYPA